MSEETRAFCLVGSWATSAYATGHIGGKVILRCADDDMHYCMQTIYDQGLHRIAMSRDGSLLAVAGYYEGVEVWRCDTKQLLWRNQQIAGIQMVAFTSQDDQLLMSTESSGLQVVNADSGARVGNVAGPKSVFPSQSEPLLLSTNRQKVTLRESSTWRSLWTVQLKSFAAICACFVGDTIIISEADGVVRVLDVKSGQIVLEFRDHRWSGYLKMAPHSDMRSAVAWASVAGDVNVGDLIRIDIAKGTAVVIARKQWIHAAPIRHGSAWVFEDGVKVEV